MKSRFTLTAAKANPRTTPTPDLNDTSNIIHHYSTDRYVAAALELFSSVALMLWYVIRLFMSRD